MNKESHCCAPERKTSKSPTSLSQPNKSAPDRSNMVKLKGGKFLMGSNDRSFPADGEGPVREVTVKPFWMDKTAVTNAQFAQFVEETSHKTQAEQFGWSFVFYQFLPDHYPDTRAVQGANWWRQVHGADWRHPEGKQSDLDGRSHHPVVHISWYDAVAFAKWAGKRLPTEAEWEYAARGGLKQMRYPWGNTLTPRGKHQCNLWQGEFPLKNSKADGYLGTAPAKSFKPNRFGLYNMAGNVWEWCNDWFSPTFHQFGSKENPQGPPNGTEKVIKGGSYLCHRSYCNRYRMGARTSNTPTSSTGHMGVRLVCDM